jgi:hypothetical protein
MPLITIDEIEEAVKQAAPFKAAGPDGIPNKVIQTALPWIKIHLWRIFNYSLSLGHCPAHFRKFITIALRKPGKDNYTILKSYQFIALLNIIKKIMNVIVAKRMEYMAEAH